MSENPTDWGAVAVDASPPLVGGESPADWGAIPTEAAAPAGGYRDPRTGASVDELVDVTTHPIDAFVGGMKEVWKRPTGWSQKDVEWFQKKGWVRQPGQAPIESPLDVFRAFNELVFFQGGKAVDIAIRTPMSVFVGLQRALVEEGFPRDIAAMPDAFMGSPRPTGVPHKYPAVERIAQRADEAGAPPLVRDLAVVEEARDLGVVGPKRPPLVERIAAEDAARVERQKTIAAETGLGAEVVRSEPQALDKAGNIRLDRIETPEEAKNVIRQAAEEAGGPDAFMAARRGEVPLSSVQLEELAEAGGFVVAELDLKQISGMGRLMNNDEVVRTYQKAFTQSSNDVAAKSKQATLTGRTEDLMAFQEARMRHALIQEQVAGLTAEWGRTGNVFQEFLEQVKDNKSLGEFLKRKKGETLDDLRKLASDLATLDTPAKVSKALMDSRKPNFWDKAMFYWINWLISGPVSQTRNAIGNAAYIAYEQAVASTAAAAFGGIMRLAGKERGVYGGEALTRMYGLTAAVPEAITVMVESLKRNEFVPVGGQQRTSVSPSINTRTIKPSGGPVQYTAESIGGAPSRIATAMDSFFTAIAYRSEIHARAYRELAKEGMSPLEDGFWQRRADKAANPTPEMIAEASKEANRQAFVQEQGQWGKNLTKLLNTRVGGEGGPQPLKFIVPFTRVPGNIIKATIENTPLAFLDSSVRADLLGKNGAAARDTAWGRVIAGSAIAGWVVSMALDDGVTGAGPTDPKERAMWLRTHEPYSMKIGGWWYSYARFGPVGNIVSMAANLTDVAPKMKEKEYNEAAGQLTRAVSRLLLDEVGMQGLSNLSKAFADDPNRYMTKFLGDQAATLIPFSSLVRQTASFFDPVTRDVKTILDGMTNSLPFARQHLLPKRDWLGTPLTNPAYQSILRQRAVNEDPVDLEIQRLRIKPGLPEDRIGGVKLSPELYDKYLATAGTLTHMYLDELVRDPDWNKESLFDRQRMIYSGINRARAEARSAMQARYPELIEFGIQQREDHIMGKAFTKRPKRVPEGLPKP